MFSKILIANRGEIAGRVIKTAKRLGVKTVAVYSEVDQTALHTSMADEAIFIGAAPSQESYLVIDKIISAALQTGAQAIHPGYGFLSENAEFAKACADNNLVFIGPPIAAIEAMGSKSAAKTIMQNASVPLVPGYHGEDQNPQLIKDAANKMGYPVLLKAVAGGGGKGMRQVWSEADFDKELSAAKREALASFGNDHMLVEKYLTAPRHVEFQIFCDAHGNAVHLFERDCSVQRRHQKIIEEAPAPNFSADLRAAMGEAAIRAAQAINYQGAGTVEFLLDSDGSFYFMEMNTRLQVEHPVTEMISGQDLVEWQLLVADGEALPATQQDLAINGHAFEARVYAEDPSNDFLPTSGKLTSMQTPALNEFTRIDSGVIEGDNVSPYYDPMIAKLISWGETRAQALARLVSALGEYHISGITTNISFLHTLASHEAFTNAELDTGFIEKHHQSLFAAKTPDTHTFLPIISLFFALQKPELGSPWALTKSWRMNQKNKQKLTLTIDGKEHLVFVEYKNSTNCFVLTSDDQTYQLKGSLDKNKLVAIIDGHKYTATVLVSDSLYNNETYTLFVNSHSVNFALAQTDLGDDQESTSDAHFNAPMNGTIVDILVSAGDKVSQGDTLLVMEAMKMQHAIHAPEDGHVDDVFYQANDLVDGGTPLLSFTALANTTEITEQ